MLRRDLREAAQELGDREARHLVDAYYTLQGHRIEAQSQVKALKKSEEPNAVLSWLYAQHEVLEGEIKKALDDYSNSQTVGVWSRTITGIGPVIAAGLMAHIEIEKAATVGSIWRFAGYDPSLVWLGTEKSKALVAEAMEETGDVTQAVGYCAAAAERHPESLMRLAMTDPKGKTVPLTRKRLESALAKRPWNADLKVLCWKIGESFVKVAALDSDVYGKVIGVRKDLEWTRNYAGKLSAQAVQTMTEKNIGKDTDAYVWYAGCLLEADARKIMAAPQDHRQALTTELAGKPGTGKPMLPPARIHARACRYGVKLFLAHWHHVAYESHFDKPPPKPYVLEHGGHAHFIAPPNWPMN